MAYHDLRIGTSLGVMKASSFSVHANWLLRCEIGGLVVNDKRVQVEAQLRMDGNPRMKLSHYSFARSRNGASGARKGPVTDETILATVRATLVETEQRLRELLDPQPKTFTEIIVDDLTSTDQVEAVHEILKAEFFQLFDTQTVEIRRGCVVVTGCAQDEARVISALLAAAVPASVRSRSVVRIVLAELPDTVNLVPSEDVLDAYHWDPPARASS